MELTISITGADGAVKASTSGAGAAALVYTAFYEDGDIIWLTSDQPGATCWHSWKTVWVWCVAICPASFA